MNETTGATVTLSRRMIVGGLLGLSIVAAAAFGFASQRGSNNEPLATIEGLTPVADVTSRAAVESPASKAPVASSPGATATQPSADVDTTPSAVYSPETSGSSTYNPEDGRDYYDPQLTGDPLAGYTEGGAGTYDDGTYDDGTTYDVYDEPYDPYDDGSSGVDTADELETYLGSYVVYP